MLDLPRKNRNYRLLLTANTVSNLGDGLVVVALPWLAALLTRDPVLIAAVATAQRLPWFLFALPIGVWTDQADRKALMVRADIVRVLLMGLVLALILSPSGAGEMQGVLALAFLAFLFGTAEVVRDNAAQTVLPALVDKSDLEQANGQMWSAERLMNQFVGPPLAGLLISLGIALPFGLNALGFAASAALIWLIALPPRCLPRTGSFWAALWEGLRWMRQMPNLLRLAIMLGIINAVFMGGMTILVLYAQDVLGLSSFEFGVLIACGATGGVLGGLVAPTIARRLGMRASLLLALGVFAGLQLLIGVFSSVALTALALFLEGLSGMLWNVVTVSYRQRLIPDELLGRVNSVYRFFGWGGMPFGALAAGAVVAVAEPGMGRHLALHVPYLVAALTCALLALYALFKLRFDEVT